MESRDPAIRENGIEGTSNPERLSDTIPGHPTAVQLCCFNMVRTQCRSCVRNDI